ncbi:hypothetical protein ACFXC8_43570 [Streptomyces sp. NPDC059441]|uniref:hypothetical protein n=1 Tax=Streptomyces sp. NPDC059441 TaxID=3346829 RepID=UPI0036B162CF
MRERRCEQKSFWKALFTCHYDVRESEGSMPHGAGRNADCPRDFLDGRPEEAGLVNYLSTTGLRATVKSQDLDHSLTLRVTTPCATWF